jgi:hypothetical protein
MLPKDDEIPKHRSKKDKRKWCGGKVGREHDPVWEHSRKHIQSPNLEWYEYYCQRCQKSLDTWWLFSGDPSVWPSINTEYERPVIGSREPLKKKVKDE